MTLTAAIPPITRHLGAIIHALTPLDVAGNIDIQVSSITWDLQQVAPGTVFVAVVTKLVPGDRQIQPALRAGASAIIAQSPPPHDWPANGPAWLYVPDALSALSPASAAFYGYPAADLAVLAVTGTNGKTTVATLLRDAINRMGSRAGLIGTVVQDLGGVERPPSFTTPPPNELHGLFAAMRAAGCTHVAMEASSQGLHVNRLADVPVRVAGFTNLTRDHLDYHHTMEAYRASKWRLFQNAETACFHIDDATGRDFARDFAGRRLTVSTAGDASADIAVIAADYSLDGVHARVRTPAGELVLALRMLGRHNLENALVALGMAYLAGFDLAHTAAALSQSRGAPGRLEPVPGPRRVLLDYAHNPDGLAQILASLRPLTRGRLICVFSANGNRDRGKRPEMGAIAAAGADIAILTTGHPRGEDAQAIIDQVAAGFPADARHCSIVPDRAQAIELAIAMAHPDDLVVIAGKGHETYQIIGDQRIPFDDRHVAATALARHGTMEHR